MEALTVQELKGLCQQRGLAVSGKKEELIERLRKGASVAAAARTKDKKDVSTPTSSSAKMTDGVLFPADYDALTIPQLKDLCRERSVAVGGIKDDLVARLKGSDPRFMTIPQLKDRCRDSGLTVSGSKTELAERVMRVMGKSLLNKSLDELKDMCRQRGVSMTGRKEDLVDRLNGIAPASSTKPSNSSFNAPTSLPIQSSRPSSASSKSGSTATKSTPASTSTTGAEVSYDSMTLNQLKDLCRGRTLPVTGKKEELAARLKQHDVVVRATFKSKKRKDPAPTTTATTSKKQKPAAIPVIAAPGMYARRTGPTVAQEAAWAKAKATTSNTARRSAPAPSRSTGQYIVYSTCAYPPDGFHSYMGPGEPKFDKTYTSKDEANRRVRHLFYEKNSWGLGADEMEDHDVEETYSHNGLLQLSVCPPDSELWLVAAKSSGDHDASDSESDNGYNDRTVYIDDDSDVEMEDT
ncbi:hypothetical protein Poli38472_000259 [Pythium oligandrum]|uniref:SAP domain-containing protein n=1 Tax=Pythium oligandrum TaxID=41045 RepID=A0A8K1CBL9_PYTOL|nr:hypothetical protein Poli38472_000259 [Pythium oligandrum]|eukprot:TMW60217.1 hypothetical protein Poli38472_000259 [Pythium oligandrum]